MGCRLWGLPELDTTEATQQQQQSISRLEHVMILYAESPRESTGTLLKPKDRFYKVTGHKPAQSNRCHETRRQLLPGRKAMTNLDSVLKSRDITLPTKVHTVKARVFPVAVRAGRQRRQNAKELTP